MKVVLIQQVKGLGKAGDIVSVSDGYAQNYLIPRGLARQATAGVLKNAAQQKEVAVRREAKERAEAEEVAEALAGVPVIIKSKAGEKGHLYGSITGKDIADAVSAQKGLSIDRKKVELPEPIKQVGEHQVKVKLYSGVEASFTVRVEEA